MTADLSRLLTELEEAHANQRTSDIRKILNALPQLLAELRRRDEALAAVREVLAFVEAKRDRYDDDPDADEFDKGRAWAYDVAVGRLRKALAAHSEQPEEAR